MFPRGTSPPVQHSALPPATAPADDVRLPHPIATATAPPSLGALPAAMAPHSPPVTVLRTPTGVAVQALAFLPRPASDAGAVLATADADGTLRVWHVGHTAMLDVVEHAVSDAAIGVTALPPGPLPAGGGADGGDGSGGGGGGDDKDGGEYGGAAPVTGGRLVGRPLATLVVQDKTGMVVRVAVTTTHAGSDDDSDGEGDDTDSAATSSDTNDGDDAEVTLRLSRPSRLGVTPPPSAGFTPAWWPTLPTGGVGGGMGRGVVTPTPTPDGGCGLSIGGVPAPVAHTPPRGMVTALADGCAGFEDGTVVLLPPGGGGVVDVGVPAALPSGDGGDSGGGGDGGGDGDGGRAPLLDGPVLALAPCRGWLAAAGATSTLAVVPAVAGGGARGARVRTRSTGVGGLAWGRGGMLAAACWDGKVRLYQVRRRPGGGERGGVSLCQLASLVHHNGRYVAGGRGGGGLHRGGGRGERGWGELAGAAWCGMALPPPPLLCAAWEGFGWHRGRRRGCGGPSAPPAAPGRHWLAGMRCCARGARLRRRHERNECGSGGGASFFLCLVLQPPATGGGGGGVHLIFSTLALTHALHPLPALLRPCWLLAPTPTTRCALLPPRIPPPQRSRRHVVTQRPPSRLGRHRRHRGHLAALRLDSRSAPRAWVTAAAGVISPLPPACDAAHPPIVPPVVPPITHLPRLRSWAHPPFSLSRPSPVVRTPRQTLLRSSWGGRWRRRRPPPPPRSPFPHAPRVGGFWSPVSPSRTPYLIAVRWMASTKAGSTSRSSLFGVSERGGVVRARRRWPPPRWPPSPPASLPSPSPPSPPSPLVLLPPLPSPPPAPLQPSHPLSAAASRRCPRCPLPPPLPPSARPAREGAVAAAAAGHAAVTNAVADAGGPAAAAAAATTGQAPTAAPTAATAAAAAVAVVMAVSRVCVDGGRTRARACAVGRERKGAGAGCVRKGRGASICVGGRTGEEVL